MAETHETLEVLPQHGTLMDGQDSDGVSRLMRASANGDTQTVKSLLAEGAQVNWQGNHGDTALLYACAEISSNKIDEKCSSETARTHESIIKALLDHGALVDLQNQDGLTPLIHASLHGHAETVKTLLDHGAQVDLQDKDGASALISASNYGHTDRLHRGSTAIPSIPGQAGWIGEIITPQ